MVEQRLDGAIEAFPRGGGGEARKPQKEEKEDSSNKKFKKRKTTTTTTTAIETDFLFGKKKQEEPTSKAKKRKTLPEEGVAVQSMLPIGGGGVVVPSSSSKKKAPTIEALGFSKLAQNTKVLATVKEVQQEFAVVSLPNLLTGYMLPESSSGGTDYPLPSSLRVGQTLAVAVRKVVSEHVKGQSTPRRRIQVTALPKAVNVREEEMFQKKDLPVRGQVTSMEDHGCLVDLGLGRKGFLKFEDIQGDYDIVEEDEIDKATSDKEHILNPGRLLDFYVLSNTNNVYSLKLPNKKTFVNQAVAPPATSKSAPYTLASITPGWLVNARIEAMARNGLCVTFLGNVFRGAIEMGHLGGYHIPKSRDDDAWKALFHKHQHFPARIIAVDVPTKLIRLTLLPHLIEYTPPPPLPSVGSIIEDCTVIRTDPGIGALLALPEEYNAESNGMSKKMRKSSELFQNVEFQEASSIRAVYVHISKAMEGEKNANSSSTFGKEFAPSTKHKVRIISQSNWMDGVASGACAPSILEAHVLTHGDLKAGQVYKQVPVVGQLKGGSVLVQLGGNGIRALIPPLHLLDSNKNNANSEYRKKILKEKFSVDAKVDVRVLWVDPIKKKCLATAKKSLIKASDSEIISSYEDLKLGGMATGFVSKIEKKSMYITFCNRVYGVVTARSLAAELGMENIQDNFAIGDVVTCRVVKLKKRRSRRSSGVNDSDEEDDDNDGDGKRAYWEVTLSLKIDGEGMLDDDQVDHVDVTNPKQVRIQAGAILPMKSMKIIELVKGKPKDRGAFVPGYAIVSIKSKHLLDASECDNMLSSIECKLPFDQILDEYSAEDIESVEALDALAESVLKVGKKINQKGIILTDPHKSNVDYSSGIGKLTVVSIRKKLIQTAEQQYAAEESNPEDIILPAPKTKLFVGALLQGYVAQIDQRYGAFIRFLDGLTGLVPKKRGGLDLPLFETIVSRVKAVDAVKGKMHLEPINAPSAVERESQFPFPLDIGDKVEARIEKIDFFAITLHILDENLGPDKAHVTLHCTLKDSPSKKVKCHKKPVSQDRHKIRKSHPFYGLKPGQTLSDLTIVYAKWRHGKFQVYLTDRSVEKPEGSVAPTFVSNNSALVPGMETVVVVTGVAPKNKGVYVEASPTVKGFIPGIELSKDLKILNDIESHVAVGSKITCCVMDETQWNENRAKNMNQSNEKKIVHDERTNHMFSVLAFEGDSKVVKPVRGDLTIGRIQRGLKQALSPSLMLALRGGFVGRCCITELEEHDEWENMPIGRVNQEEEEEKDKTKESAMDVDEEEDDVDESQDEESSDEAFPDGKYVECRVLRSIPKHAMVDVSLRSTRVEGDIDDDVPPEIGETVQGYVVETNKKGCFVRIARNVEGRVTLKELCDGFLPDPAASFPPGRLVVGKVKGIRDAPKKAKHSNNPVQFQVDLDMRESTLLEQNQKLAFNEIEVGKKYKGTVTRVESYGVFVQIEGSNVSGLAHMSECSDKFIKNLGALYDPGDLVKVLVIKKDAETKKLGFSMKASHFEDDEDSDDDSSIGVEEDSDEEMADVPETLDSEDENFGTKLAAQMDKDSDEDSDSDASSNESSGDDESTSGSSAASVSSDEDDEQPKIEEMDTEIGFDWGPKRTSNSKSHLKDEESSDDSDSDSDSDDDDADKPSSHKSRKKQAQRRREEQEITRRETALADGTADENPETAGDFERMLAGNPNSSELWIRYMAFYLSVADIPSARKVAEKALERIEFRQETEKLNVWTALLTLEHKYGTGDSLQKTVDRACGQCNPKQVYLRTCEILEKDPSTPASVTGAMYTKMCKKFKSKKKVWLAHLEYLLKHSKHQEAQSLLKRGLLSLPSYKHAETMSKFAQLEFEYGSSERARTLFDGILEKYPKRLDLMFVYLDKEVKFGKVTSARTFLEQRVQDAKLSDKQMKSLFKKWFRMEEEHGSEEDQQHVKDVARDYVERTTT